MRHRQSERRLARAAGKPSDAAAGLHRQVAGRRVRQRSSKTIGRDNRDDRRRIQRPHPSKLIRQRAAALEEDDLRRLDQAREVGAAFFRVEIQNDALLACVEEQECPVGRVFALFARAFGGSMPIRQALRRLDADNFGAEVGE